MHKSGLQPGILPSTLPVSFARWLPKAQDSEKSKTDMPRRRLRRHGCCQRVLSQTLPEIR